MKRLMSARIISISGAAYDGHPVSEMLASIAACGAPSPAK